MESCSPTELVDNFVDAVGITHTVDRTLEKYAKYFHDGSRETVMGVVKDRISRLFTIEELGCLVALYTSPLGSKLKRFLPIVLAELTQLMEQLIQQEIAFQGRKNTVAQA